MTVEIVALDQEDVTFIAELTDLDLSFGRVYSHYVMPDDAVAALLDHTVATALCGFQWVPTRIVGNELPLCPRCKEIYLARGWS